MTIPSHVDPTALAAWGVVVGVSFLFLIFVVIRGFRQLRSYRRDLLVRLGSLRISKMLDRLGVGTSRYVNHAHSLDVERSLWICEHCPTIEQCDECLEQGKEMDERSFCPNAEDLAAYRPRWRRGHAGPLAQHPGKAPAPPMPRTESPSP